MDAIIISIFELIYTIFENILDMMKLIIFGVLMVIMHIVIWFKLPVFTSVVALYAYEQMTGRDYLTPITLFYTTIGTWLLMSAINYFTMKKAENEN